MGGKNNQVKSAKNQENRNGVGWNVACLNICAALGRSDVCAGCEEDPNVLVPDSGPGPCRHRGRGMVWSADSTHQMAGIINENNPFAKW